MHTPKDGTLFEEWCRKHERHWRRRANCAHSECMFNLEAAYMRVAQGYAHLRATRTSVPEGHQLPHELLPHKVTRE